MEGCSPDRSDENSASKNSRDVGFLHNILYIFNAEKYSRPMTKFVISLRK